MQLYRTISELILGSRLKRLGEKLFFDIGKIYKHFNIPFEPGWFPVFYLLKMNTKMTVKDIALKLEITQSGASQMINSLQKKGIISYCNDSTDKRIRAFTLTSYGLSILKQIQPLWDSIKRTIEEVLKEGENSQFLMHGLTELEDSLLHMGLFSRVKKDVENKHYIEHLQVIALDTLNIDRYQKKYRECLLDWYIENNNHPTVSIDLVDTLNDDRASGLFKRYLQCIDDVVLGVAILHMDTNKTAHLLVFHIDTQWRRFKLEQRFLQYCVDQAKHSTYKKMTLFVNRRRSHLLRCCKNIGFTLEPRNDASCSSLIHKNSNSSFQELLFLKMSL